MYAVSSLFLSRCWCLPALRGGEGVRQWLWTCPCPQILSAISRCGARVRARPVNGTVVADPAAANGLAIAQVSKDRTDYRFPLAIYKPFSCKDVEVSVGFKPVAGTVDEAGGIAVRLLTPDDYYVAGANVGFYRGGQRPTGTARQRQCQGVRECLAHARAQGRGRPLTVSFDGKPLISAQDKTFSDRGKVALWTKADSVTYFDTISITPLG